MKALQNAFVCVTLAMLAGCSVESAPGEGSPETVTSSSTEQAVTLLDCQKQVAACTLSAKSFLALGKCTSDFQSCALQASADLLGQKALLADCRKQTTTCLNGAVTLPAISACRDIYQVCTADVQSTASTVLANAVDAAQDAIDKAAALALDTIQAAGSTATGALDALTKCEAGATQCLAAATTPTAVTACQDGFEDCLQGALDLLDTVTAPLPGPTPSALVTDLEKCQGASTTCLAKAVTTLDATACRSALDQCVSIATGAVDQTVTDVTQILPLPLPLPSVTQPVDCSKAAANCLLALGNPVDCAAQAALCLTK